MTLWYTIVLFAFLNSWMSQCLSAGQCQQDWSLFNNSCFKFYSGRKNWTDAESQCTQNNGHLTSIMSSAENGHVHSLLSRTLWAWIGFHDRTTEDTFEWFDGSSVNYTNWKKGEPNNLFNEDCGIMGVDGKWYDLGCENSGPFVCRKAPSPTLSAKPTTTTNGSTTQVTTAVATTQLVATCTTIKRTTTQAATPQAATTQQTSQAAITQTTTTQTATAIATTQVTTHATTQTATQATSETTKAASLRSTTKSQPQQSPTIIQTTNLESRSPVTSQSPIARATTATNSMMKTSNTPSTDSQGEPTTQKITASDSTNYTVIYASIGAGLGLLFVMVVIVVVLIKRRNNKYAPRGSTQSTQNLASGVLYSPAEEVCRIQRPQSHKSSIDEKYHAMNSNVGHEYHYITATPQKEQNSEKGSSKGRETQRSNSIVESEKYEEPIEVNSVTAGNTGRVEPIYCEPGNTEEFLYGQLQQWKLPNIDRKTVQTVNKLGSGQFGTVYKAVWNKGQQHGQIVAVKSLHASDESSRVKFLREAFIMGQFKHKNVVTLHGIVISGKPMMIVLEYVEKGDLKKFLLNLRPSDNTSYLPANTADRLLRMSREIATGMKYLESKSFVHRDLAARNIMLDSDENCKIGDFGLARDLADENYYITSGGKIPVRWTAPEALNYRKYSTASDVWSYGIVLYEIWSIGERPYGVMGNKELAGLVATGERLPPPPGCPRPIYHLLISCWHPDYHRRMSFRRVVSYLSGEDWSLLTNRKDEESIVGHLGDELVVSKRMYRDLQKSYIGMD